MKYIFAVVILALGSYQASAQNIKQKVLRGVVVDTNESAVSNAKIDIATETGENSSCFSDKNGKFECDLKSRGVFSIEISAEGFSVFQKNFGSITQIRNELKFILQPATIRSEVIVTINKTETRLSDTPASIATISKKDLKSAASPAIDDVLRQTAGFSLFRRSNSRNANPTTQGTSLRGINASGASRSLVLFDGIPLNDPFGGWIYWSRVSSIEVEQIEVMRGGASGLYGSGALGGTISVIPRRSRGKLNASVEIFGGTQNTFSGSAFVGFNKKDWSGDFVLSTFQSKGYKIIDEQERGLVDDFANSHNTNFSGRIQKDFGESARLFFKAAYFGEARNNGTPAQKNRSHLREFSAGGDFGLNEQNPNAQDSRFKVQNSKLSLRVFGDTQVFDQTFSAVSADRNSEDLVRLQRVPSQRIGFSGRFSTFVKSHTLLFGFEASDVRGSSDEIGFFGGGASSKLGAGGRERAYGVYFQDFVRVNERIILVGNLRFDHWKNSRALRSLFLFSSNSAETTIFPDRTESAFSPGGSMLFRASEKISLFFNASRSFRAPTLNELYRGFRVGDVITDPNENLRTEKANNFEAGTSYATRNFYARGNFYWTDVSDAVANVTLERAPNLIFRQRQNAAKIRVRGIEIEAETRFREFSFATGYLFADAKFAEFPENKEIEGLRIPQVPRHQFTFQTTYAHQNGWNFSLQGRAASAQFDDDLNKFELESYFQLDAFAAKNFRENFQVFAAIENVFNSRYSIGKTPVRSINSPINLRIGFRWN